MPPMGRLVFLLRCFALIALALLPACTSTSGQAGSSSPLPNAQRPVTPVTLTLWHSWSGAKRSALNSLARSYEQANPDIRIRLESRPAPELLRQYRVSVADQSAPQLLLTHGRYVGELAEQQYIAPLDSLFDTAALTDVLPQALDSARYNGQLYGMPISFEALVLFYDRRRVATPPVSFDDVLRINEAQRDLPVEQRPLSLAYHLMPETTLPYLYGWGGSVVGTDGTPSLTTTGRDATMQWLDWVSTLQKNQDVVASTDFSAVDVAVQAGRAWSVIDWSHRRTNYAQVWPPEAVGITALPSVQPSQATPTILLSQVLCINTVTSREQRIAAQDFVRFMVTREAQETLSNRGEQLPVNLTAQVSPQLEPYMQVAQSSQALGSNMTSPTVWRPLNEMFRAVISGTPPGEAVDAAHSILQSPQP